MPVELPLEALPSFGKDLHLARDQLVDLASRQPVEVPVADEPLTVGVERLQEPNDGPVSLDGDAPWRRVGIRALT